MSRLSLALAAALMLLAVSTAYAQPCIECRDCRTNNCWRQCKQVCPPNNRPPPIVNGDQCRRRGDEFGRVAARDACETARRFCNGGQRPMAAKSNSIGLVTRRQCANIAFGQCQQTAMNRRKSPCGKEMQWGFRQCNQRQFMEFYTGEVNELCSRQAATITN